MAYVVAARGGAPIALVMELLEAEPSACLFGELRFDFVAPLVIGQTYAVDARIVSVKRKRGRRFPVFDRVELRSRVADADTGAEVAVVTQVWLVARSEDPG
jgi:acyl dehydratase